ncbi:formin-like protein 6 [Corylus avellana]|uniref:formin-like protein 6 n=1 Tax=Corylus avellana TaxID=13451 RepID=UPI001E22275C|nr:formin-like protein 6 [Corylus avellana]
MESPTSTPLDLEITVVSAKHLKNVNWRNGDLKPYATVYLDPGHRLATRSDDSGSTRPVWNERFTLPLTRPLCDSLLTLEIFHSRPSETPKPLVGALRVPLGNLVGDSTESTRPIHTLELCRPSGRPQGKVRLKLALRERCAPPPDYHIAPRNSHFYSSAPQCSTGHYSLPPSRPFLNRTSSSVGPVAPAGPSAPVDFSSSNDHNPPPAQPYLASNYSPPGGPSAPIDFTRYDHESVTRDRDGYRYGSYRRDY